MIILVIYNTFFYIYPYAVKLWFFWLLSLSLSDRRRSCKAISTAPVPVPAPVVDNGKALFSFGHRRQNDDLKQMSSCTARSLGCTAIGYVDILLMIVFICDSISVYLYTRLNLDGTALTSLQLLVIDLRFSGVSNHGMLVIAGTSSCLMWQAVWKFKKCAGRFLIVPITGAKVVSACHAASQWQFALKALREPFSASRMTPGTGKKLETLVILSVSLQAPQQQDPTESLCYLIGYDRLGHASAEELKAFNLETSVVTYGATVSAVVCKRMATNQNSMIFNMQQG